MAKPVKPVLDANSSLVSGLVFDSAPYESSGTTTSDTVAALSGAITGATWDFSTYGVDLDYSASTSAITYTSSSSMNTVAKFSYEALWFCRSIGGGSLGRVFQKGNAGVGAPFYFMVDTITTSSLEINAAQVTTSGQWTWPFSFNTWYHMVITYDTTSLSAPILYINGISQTLTPVTAPTGSYGADDTTFVVGNNIAASRNFDGKISYVRLWNRQLSATEAALLAGNPFRIYLQGATRSNALRPRAFAPGIAR